MVRIYNEGCIELDEFVINEGLDFSGEPYHEYFITLIKLIMEGETGPTFELISELNFYKVLKVNELTKYQLVAALLIKHYIKFVQQVDVDSLCYLPRRLCEEFPDSALQMDQQLQHIRINKK